MFHHVSTFHHISRAKGSDFERPKPLMTPGDHYIGRIQQKSLDFRIKQRHLGTNRMTTEKTDDSTERWQWGQEDLANQFESPAREILKLATHRPTDLNPQGIP